MIKEIDDELWHHLIEFDSYKLFQLELLAIMAVLIATFALNLFVFDSFNIWIFMTKYIKFLLNQFILLLIFAIAFNVIFFNFKIVYNVFFYILKNKLHFRSFLHLFALVFIFGAF
tara:strand:- start:616 stop:960 length:345 start_codon:yes stop_codon:yes gene_type:complete